MTSEKYSFTITNVFDDNCSRSGFLTGFGFSALIHNNFTQEFLLFDAGDNGKILIHNINKLDIDISKISKVIISHNHYDHTRGLNELLKINQTVEVYVPLDSELAFNRAFPEISIHGVKELTKIEKNIYSSGQLGTGIKEQALFLKTKDDDFGLVVGCTHPGLENFIIKARGMHDIKAVIGGFHGFNRYSYLEGIDIIGACHCTMHLDAIKNRFPNQFKKFCVGESLII